MDGPTEINYEPCDCSDVTVHFGNSAFHVHSAILKKESKVLRVAVDGADSTCNLTAACKQSGHRCFTLNSPFGTTRVDDGQMRSFFDHMYDPTKLFETPESVENAAPIGSNYQPILIGPGVSSRVSEAWTGGNVTGYLGSQIEVTKDGKIYLLPANEIKAYNHALGTKTFQRVSLNQFLLCYEVVVRLCHFFDCTALLRSCENLIKGLVMDHQIWKQQADMFTLLSLCDYCHFDSLVHPITVLILKSNAKLNVDDWKSLVKFFREETNAVVMEAAFATR